MVGAPSRAMLTVPQAMLKVLNGLSVSFFDEITSCSNDFALPLHIVPGSFSTVPLLPDEDSYLWFLNGRMYAPLLPAHAFVTSWVLY